MLNHVEKLDIRENSRIKFSNEFKTILNTFFLCNSGIHEIEQVEGFEPEVSKVRRKYVEPALTFTLPGQMDFGFESD